MPRTSIKGQVLVDLVAEFIEPPMEELEPAKNMDGKLVGTISQHAWMEPWLDLGGQWPPLIFFKYY